MALAGCSNDGLGCLVCRRGTAWCLLDFSCLFRRLERRIYHQNAIAVFVDDPGVARRRVLLDLHLIRVTRVQAQANTFYFGPTLVTSMMAVAVPTVVTQPIVERVQIALAQARWSS